MRMRKAMTQLKTIATTAPVERPAPILGPWGAEVALRAQLREAGCATAYAADGLSPKTGLRRCHFCFSPSPSLEPCNAPCYPRAALPEAHMASPPVEKPQSHLLSERHQPATCRSSLRDEAGFKSAKVILRNSGKSLSLLGGFCRRCPEMQRSSLMAVLEKGSPRQRAGAKGGHGCFCGLTSLLG